VVLNLSRYSGWLLSALFRPLYYFTSPANQELKIAFAENQELQKRGDDFALVASVSYRFFTADFNP
jgi:hypothetical protein